MKNNNPKHNNDNAILSLTPREQALKLVEANDKLEAERNADPNWTSVIVESDNKTLIRKWTKADKLNEKLGR